eukprot:gene1114-1481_t
MRLNKAAWDAALVSVGARLRALEAVTCAPTFTAPIGAASASSATCSSCARAGANAFACRRCPIRRGRQTPPILPVAAPQRCPLKPPSKRLQPPPKSTAQGVTYDPAR